VAGATADVSSDAQHIASPTSNATTPLAGSCTARHQHHHYHHSATRLMADSFEASIHHLTHRREAHSRARFSIAGDGAIHQIEPQQSVSLTDRSNPPGLPVPRGIYMDSPSSQQLPNSSPQTSFIMDPSTYKTSELFSVRGKVRRHGILS
jgi:hypothetical protein